MENFKKWNTKYSRQDYKSDETGVIESTQGKFMVIVKGKSQRTKTLAQFNTKKEADDFYKEYLNGEKESYKKGFYNT